MDGISINAGAMVAKFKSHMRTVEQKVREGGSKAVQSQAKSLRQVIVNTTPVDSGDLKASWSQATQAGDALTWHVSTDVAYAPILEYGGYRTPGPRTTRLGGGDLGAGFTAGAGVYSLQAPLGWVRRALAGTVQPFRVRLRGVLRQAWGELGGPSDILGMAEAESIFGISLGQDAGGFVAPIGMANLRSTLRGLGHIGKAPSSVAGLATRARRQQRQILGRRLGEAQRGRKRET